MLVNEKATVISADVPATNGIIQLMDQVLLPTTWAYPDKTILQIIQASPNLSILRTALEKTDLAWIFASAMVVKGYGPMKLGKSWEACWDVGDI
eukprot:symbB.v1.2.005688.t1/scaffold334.1/size226555/11